MRIGFIGLGNMGAAIAANLLKANHEVTVWNRSAVKAEPLIAAGAKLAASPGEAAAKKDAVVTMLADDAALEAVTEGEHGLLAGMDAGGLHISMSTIAVATAERLTQSQRARDQRLVCAPVFGRPEAAAAGKLFFVAAGEAADLAACAPVFAAAGRRVFEVGPKPSAANLIKLCGNFMILSAIESLAEAMTLAEKGGVPKTLLLEVLTGSLFDAPLFHNYGKLLVEQRFKPAGFAAPLGLKDMRLAGAAADALRVPMPLLSLLRDHLLQTIAVEGTDVDWSGIGLTIAKNAGLN
jgi:3-hydroxyisobutyrate dehydrogenase-like beta-hydroxyacid dehydrogenase